MNEILLFVSMALNFGGILLAYKLFGKKGLFAWVVLATLISNLEVVKTISLFGFEVPLGTVTYSTTFLATDILSERYGGKESRRAVFVGFFSTIMFTILAQLTLHFAPSETDFAQGAMEVLFGFLPRIAAGSVVAYLASNILDTFLFDMWRKIAPKHLWLRNNGSTMISQFVDTVIFGVIAFAGTMPVKTIAEITVVSYVMKFAIAAADTPFMYIARKMRVKDDEERIDTAS